MPRTERIEAGSFELFDTNKDLENISIDKGALAERGAFADVLCPERSRSRIHVVQLIEHNLGFPFEIAEGLAERSTALCVSNSEM